MMITNYFVLVKDPRVARVVRMVRVVYVVGVAKVNFSIETQVFKGIKKFLSISS